MTHCAGKLFMLHSTALIKKEFIFETLSNMVKIYINTMQESF